MIVWPGPGHRASSTSRPASTRTRVQIEIPQSELQKDAGDREEEGESAARPTSARRSEIKTPPQRGFLLRGRFSPSWRRASAAGWPILELNA